MTKRKYSVIIFSFLALVLLTAPFNTSGSAKIENSSIITSSITIDPVLIDGDDEFESFPYKTGSGTDLDPYIIYGLVINAHSDIYLAEIDDWISYSIAIINTECNFILRNIEVDYTGTRLFVVGMLFYNNEKGTVENSEIKNVYAGFGLYATSNIVIKNNIIHEFKKNALFGNYGFYILESDNIVLENNVIDYQSDGLIFGASIQNTGNSILEGNHFIHCGISITSGDVNTILSNEITDDNLVDGYPVIFLTSKKGGNIKKYTSETTIGQMIIVDCQNLAINGLVLQGGSIPLEIAHCNNIKLRDVDIYGSNRFGFQVSNSEKISIKDSRLADNGLANILLGTGSKYVIDNCDLSGAIKSIRVIGVTDSTIQNTVITGTKTTAIEVLSSTGITIKGNDMQGFGYGVYTGSFQSFPRSENNIVKENIFTNIKYRAIFGGEGYKVVGNTIQGNTWWGITVYSDSIIKENSISGTNYGIIVYDNDSLISDNTIDNCMLEGIYMEYSAIGNVVTSNNLIDNNDGGVQGYDTTGENSWDGNYWNDYESRYPSATNDGFVWDTPYELNGETSDNYPIVFPITI